MFLITSVMCRYWCHSISFTITAAWFRLKQISELLNGCTLRNPAPRLTTGHRSPQRPRGAPPAGGATENGWERRRRSRGRNTQETPTPPIKGGFHAVRQAERPERGKAAWECVLPYCESLPSPECGGGTGSAGLCHWKLSNVFVWRGGRISCGQYGAVILVFVFFFFFHFFRLLCSLVRFSFSFQPVSLWEKVKSLIYSKLGGEFPDSKIMSMVWPTVLYRCDKCGILHQSLESVTGIKYFPRRVPQ